LQRAAETLFGQALALPQYLDTVRTHLGLGVCLARAGRLAEAETVLARAYELDPGNPVTAFNLSDVLYRRGEYERVRFYMRRVNAQQDQSNAQTLWLAVRVERHLGNTAGVQQLGGQLRDRFPQSPEALLFDRGRFDD
jgi:type IV pilus assembly protein PilF